jgi:DNA polymerase I-like protein with 3'-5' exonuclease and polymerase domains
MSKIIFDLESDGLIEETTKIHCICTYDLITGEARTWSSQKEGDIEAGVRYLMEGTELIGHNILGFDLIVLKKLYPFFKSPANSIDTLILSRLVYPDMKERDFQRLKTDFPKQLIGRHSLESWGHRLGCKKGDYKKNNDFSTWSREMESYCENDVVVTRKLYEMFLKEKYSPDALDLEQEFALIMSKQEKKGVLFDVEKARTLYATLAKRRVELEQELQRVFEPEKVEMKSTKFVFMGETYDTKAKAAEHARHYAKHYGKTIKSCLELIQTGGNKTKEIPFNCGSRDQIANRFIKKYSWKPVDFTPDGKPKIDESVLKAMPYPEAAPLCEYLMIQKRLGQLAEGKEAWVKLEKSGRIHGRVNTNGAVTGRCTHSNPNMAQVPAVRAPYGKECRELFTVQQGYRLVGADASGLELRCLAHFMGKWDDGAYAKELLEGDIHTANQKAAGLQTRDQAKTFIYAFLYGAGDAKIGTIVGKGQEEGSKLRANFLKKTPALKYLKDAVEKAAKRGYLLGLDGRKLWIRSEHAALNTLLQSAGALVMKKACCILNKKITEWAYTAHFVLNVHDEWQLEVKEHQASHLGELAVQSIREAGDFFKFRCPLDGEYRIGNNWAETH